MLKTHLDVPTVIAHLNNIVDRVGEDHFVTDCLYAKTEGMALVPVCIVGQLFADLGALRAVFRNDGGAQMGACFSTNDELWDALEVFGITADEPARNLLRRVQQAQDDQMTWASAVSGAITAELDGAKSRASEDYRKTVESLEALYCQTDALADWEKELLGV